ncbi:CCA tRNA nucleotidyltransferase [Pseudoponticoccus marisrubri]|uniref:Poly(A) polymerase n=1 Tax=Pseudoponticoccus marisrubri TaxID=1685382 RepID=A0A0W7WG24_9RHOB|nr:CCA tRNA nucleotidyltransferase [Pseudoponticoccus marisrubri]KUF09553.1 poly(A) polymerase [Pseudoponticoccus marisrubri]
MTRVTGDWLSGTGTQTVLGMLEAAGHEGFAVGGCVRNALLGVAVSDVDISTDARPERVMELAKAAGLKAVPTGIDHGTVTIVVAGEGFEVTTYRADVETDGRRAVVRFADDIAQDAVRRDFTMNALYAARDGQLVDPLGGLPDLHARRVRFIEDADRRIREDYLRILRFFRFSAWYGDPETGMDPEALAAIAGNLDGLDTLSRERVGGEMLKILAAPDPVMAVSVMERVGVLPHVLPGGSARALGPLRLLETQVGLEPDPLRRLAATGFADGAALRLSKARQKVLDLFHALVPQTASGAEIAYRHGAATARDVLVLRAATLEQPLAPDALSGLEAAAQARCPVTARDLMPAYKGAALGEALRALEARWIASGFTLDKPALLATLPEG